MHKPTDWLFSLVLVAVFSLPATIVAAQDIPSKPKTTKVYVAAVSNMSASAALLDRMTERLLMDLRDEKIDAVSIDSSTTTEGKLHPARENGEDAKNNECNYILLSQISGPHLSDPRNDQRTPQISIGGKVPSVDASDPLGGSPGPVYRQNLQISFAVFRTDVLKPVLDTVVLAQLSGAALDNFLSAMDPESNRVSHELKKK